MANRKNKLNKDYYYDLWLERLTNIACNLFKWEGLPKEINKLALEKQIMLGGYAILFKDKQLDKYFALGGALKGVDVYGYPSIATPIAKGLNGKDNLSFNFGDYNIGEDCVIIWCNSLRGTANEIIIEYADKLADVDTAIKMNTRAMKKPIWIKGSEQAKSSLETLMRQYDQDYWIMLTDKSLGINGEIDTLNFNISAIEILNLQKQHENLLNEFFTSFGVQSTVEKRERVVSGEINAMQGQTAINKSVWASGREVAIEQMKEIFGLDVKCDITQFTDESTQDEKKDKNIDTIKKSSGQDIGGNADE